MSKMLFEVNIDENKEVVIWGNTQIALNLIDFFQDHDVVCKYILEKEKWMQGSIYKGVEVVDPLMLQSFNHKTPVILATLNRSTIEQMKEYICSKTSHDHDKVYTLENLILSERDLRKDMMLNLKFQVHVVEHCNLNCRGCDHFSPISNKEFLNPEEFEKDLRQLKKLFPDSTPLISLLGGEPLLHPDIVKFFDISRDVFRSARIDLITNGLLLKQMDDDFWEASKRNKIDIRPTKYPINADYEYAENKAQEYGITYKYFLDNGTLKTLWKHPLDVNGEQDETEMYYCCGESNHCLTLDHGRLYTCSVAAFSRHFSDFFGVDLKYSGVHNGIDIYEAKDKYQVMDFLRHPIKMCKHCKVKERTFDNPFDFSEKNIKEWT